MKFIWLILFDFCFFGWISAQSKYSTDPNYIQSRTERDGFLNDYHSSYSDTTIHQQHRFIPRNFLGNLNLSSPNYLLNYQHSSAGFRLYNVPLRDYKIDAEDVSYYQTKGPFAQLTGIAGTQQLQLFRMLFANSFKNNFNISLKLNRYTSQGFYKQQQGSTNNFYVSAHYTTPGKRFGFNTFILVNNNKFQENGGITGDTMSEVNLLANKTLFPTKISRGSRENRELKAKYNNWFRLNKSNTKGFNTYLNAYSQFSQQKYKYKDDFSGNDGYYFLYYLDTLSTLDSTRVFQLNNGAGLSIQNDKKTLTIHAGYENELVTIWQKYDTAFANHLLKLSAVHLLHLKLKDSMLFTLKNTASLSYVAAGNQRSDYTLETRHYFKLVKSSKVTLNAELKLLAENRTADFLLRKWYSNHFIWENKFNSIQTLAADVNAGNKFIRVGATAKSIQNYIYLNQLGYPIQTDGNIINSSFRIQANYVFFKHIGVSLQQHLQSSSSKLISLPNSISLASLYYTGNLFKNNLNLSIGGELEYYTRFTPYAYMPATQQFLVQEKFYAGEFPFLDVFLNARIKPVNIFLKMENVLHGLLGTQYSMVPGYYQPDRAFRFGLTWTFYD